MVITAQCRAYAASRMAVFAGHRFAWTFDPVVGMPFRIL
jgi:hypothetical protein